MKCPWCLKYIQYYNTHFGDLTKEDIENEKTRLKKGFWAQIENVHKIWELSNMVYTTEDAIRMRQPVHINMETGESWFGRFWFFSLAEKRDNSLKQELEHFWILSGGCSMSWNTPICCEMANYTSDDEALNWEIQEFNDIKDITQKILKLLES